MIVMFIYIDKDINYNDLDVIVYYYIDNNLYYYKTYIDNNNIKIYSDINEYIIECYNIGEYPNIALEKSQNTIYLESKILKEMINQTSYAMSMQEVRPLLTGLNLKINGDILECTATDSYRLSKKTVKLKDSINSNINIVIPGKSVNELVYILKDEGNVEIDLFKNKDI